MFSTTCFLLHLIKVGVMQEAESFALPFIYTTDLCWGRYAAHMLNAALSEEHYLTLAKLSSMDTVTVLKNYPNLHKRI